MQRRNQARKLPWWGHNPQEKQLERSLDYTPRRPGVPGNTFSGILGVEGDRTVGGVVKAVWYETGFLLHSPDFQQRLNSQNSLGVRIPYWEQWRTASRLQITHVMETVKPNLLLPHSKEGEGSGASDTRITWGYHWRSSPNIEGIVPSFGKTQRKKNNKGSFPSLASNMHYISWVIKTVCRRLVLKDRAAKTQNQSMRNTHQRLPEVWGPGHCMTSS